MIMELLVNPFFVGFGLFFCVTILFLVTLLAKSVYLVKQAEVILIERLGRFSRVLTPGLHIVVPFVDKPRSAVWTFVKEGSDKRYHRYIHTMERIDLRESVYDFPRQNVITKDNVTMEINALLYYQITDPKAALYEIDNLPQAIEKLTQTTLRDVIGAMDLDAALVSRGQINEKLRVVLDEATDKWGVKVNRVELQEVNPPVDIRHAMEKQMRAERERREMILRSEGKKSSAILEAEGIKEAAILEATGQAEARLMIAQAESKAIAAIKDAIAGADPLPYLVAMQYMKVLPEMMKGKDDKLIVVPYESSALMSSLASMKKVFETIQ
jgi:regulator of protease activity HflC (stomatin/prohibitin superfamily)